MITFDQLKSDLESLTIVESISRLKSYISMAPGHIESRELYSELLIKQIDESIANNQDPLAIQIDLLTVIEQILDINPYYKPSIVNWMDLQVSLDFEKTDLNRFQNYIHLLEQDNTYHLQGLNFQISLDLFQDNFYKVIDTYFKIIGFFKTKKDRIQRDTNISEYIFDMVSLLTSTKINQKQLALELIYKYVNTFYYKDTFAIYQYLLLAVEFKDQELISLLARQLYPIIKNDYKEQQHDTHLNNILSQVIKQNIISDYIYMAYLALQNNLYGYNECERESHRLYLINPHNNVLKSAYAQILFTQNKHQEVLDLLEEVSYKNLTLTYSLTTYIISYHKVHQEFIDLNWLPILAYGVPLQLNTFSLKKYYDQLYQEKHIDDPESLEKDKQGYIRLCQQINVKAIEFTQAYLDQKLDLIQNFEHSPSNALMNKNMISKLYHNIGCFILEYDIEHLYPLALVYIEQSQDHDFFYYQLSAKANVYRRLHQYDNFISTIREYISYPVFERDPSDYFRFKLQLVWALVETSQIQSALEVYDRVKKQLKTFLQENGANSFYHYYLAFAFEADDAIFPYLDPQNKEPTLTALEYFQFFPKNDDVLYRLAMAYYKQGEMESFEYYAELYLDAYQEIGYDWGDEFYYVLELYIPLNYKTNSQNAIEWLDALCEEQITLPWLKSYLKKYKPIQTNFIKRLFK